MNLEEKYPFIASWVADGQIQIGQAGSWYSDEPQAAVIDAGGLVWETQEPFDSLDDLFDQMEKAICDWSRQHGIELIDRQGNSLTFPDE